MILKQHFTFGCVKVDFNSGVSSGVEDFTSMNLADGHPERDTKQH